MFDCGREVFSAMVNQTCCQPQFFCKEEHACSFIPNDISCVFKCVANNLYIKSFWKTVCIYYIYAHIYIPYIISNITYYIMHVYIIRVNPENHLLTKRKK